MKNKLSHASTLRRMAVFTGLALTVLTASSSAQIPNQPPVAGDDKIVTATVQKPIQLSNLRNNDSDPENQPINIIGITQPLHGKTTLVNNVVTYDPNTAFKGSDTFKYTISDGTLFDTADVTIENPFLLGRGRYATLFSGNPASASNTGYIQVNVGPGGNFSCLIKFADEGYRFKGTFGIDGAFQSQVNGDVGSRLITLNFAVNGGVKQITGSLSDIPFTAPFIPFIRGTPTPRAGFYTVMLPPKQIDDRAFPQGNGFGLVRINANGGASATGRLGDGTPWSSSTLLTPANQLPIYSRLYRRNNGSIYGTLTFTGTGSTTKTSGTLDWFKHKFGRDAFYRLGFQTTTDVIGSIYNSPAINGAPLTVGNTTPNATFSAVGDGIRRPKIERATLGKRPAAGAYSVMIENKTRIRANMKVDPKRGLFSGSFRVPIIGDRRRFIGAFIQGEQKGAGVYRGLHTTGRVDFIPGVPAPAQ